MLKPYDEMRKIDVSQYTEKRDDCDYLNWAKCIDLLHENGAKKVYFEPVVNEHGSSLFMSDQVFTDGNGNTNRCYEIAVRVIVDDNEWIFRGPLMNGVNPVKDNSLSQQRVWNAQTRAFVKCIAIHTGLGFDLWLKEEQSARPADDLSGHSIYAIKKRVEELITVKIQNGMTQKDILSGIGLSQKQFDTIMKYFDQIASFEKALKKL